jgi:hypothetical protein
MSTYSTNLKIELITTGDQVGTWGNTTNTNLGTALEQAIVGQVTVTFATDANKTLTLTDSPAAQDARALFLNVTSGVSLTVTRDLIVPAINKPYIVKNATTGSQSIRVIVAGVGVTVPNGKTALVYNNGTDVGYQLDHLGAFDLSGALTGTTGTFSGAVSGTTGTFSGAVSGTTGTFSGAVSGTTGTFSGAVSGTTGTFTGAVSGTTGTFTGAVSGTTGTFSGAVSGTTGTFTGDGTFSGTGQVKLPAGTTGQRSGTPANGMIRYNTTTGQFEGYSGTWGSLGGGATGGGGDQVFIENDQVVTTNYTIPADKNAGTFGPVSVNSGITVTVPSTSVWSIV